MTTVEFCSQLVRHESVMLRYAYSFNLKRDDAQDLLIAQIPDESP